MPDANMDRWAHLDRGDALHVSVAVVILSVNEGQLQVLMTNNDKGPYEDHFVLPNRILRSHEMLDPAASEVFSDAAELSGSKIEQYFTYSCPDRDPRGRVVASVYR
jgi:8-oxo-dGTP diphosphatase